MRLTKLWFIIVLLLLTIVYCFFVPKPKYKSPQIIPQLKIPFTPEGWISKDVSKDINLEDERYNFVSDVFARLYVNDKKESLLFLLLDAGNFHHPKICFGSSGFTIRELNGPILSLEDRPLRPHALYAEKGNDKFVIIFWMCIDKQPVDWTGQKLNQLLFSLFNKQKIGLMGRLDIPLKTDNIDYAFNLAQEFFNDLRKEILPGQLDYIFGKK